MSMVVAAAAIAGAVGFLTYAFKVTRQRPSDLPLMEILGAIGLILIGVAIVIAT